MMHDTALVGLLALAGCAGSQAEAEPVAAPQPMQTSPATQAGGGCLMADPGVRIDVADSEGGVVVTFTIDSERIDALRAEVQRMASMHQPGHQEGMAGEQAEMGHQEGMAGEQAEMGHQEGMAEHHGEKAMKSMMPAAAVTYQEVVGGARLVITAKDPAEAAKLRDQVRDHVARMRAGECPEMTEPEAPPPPAGAGY